MESWPEGITTPDERGRMIQAAKVVLFTVF